MVTGDNESPNPVSKILTGHFPTRSVLNHSNCDHNDFLAATVPAPEQDPPMAAPDPIHSLADVLTSLQNRPSAQQQLTSQPANSNTMTSDRENEKFRLFEDLFHTMIKMQPEMSEPMKYNHFRSFPRKGAPQTFLNINASNIEIVEVIIVFRQKYVKPESQATTKYKWHRRVFDHITRKLSDFLEELNRQSILCKFTPKSQEISEHGPT